MLRATHPRRAAAAAAAAAAAGASAPRGGVILPSLIVTSAVPLAVPPTPNLVEHVLRHVERHAVAKPPGALALVDGSATSPPISFADFPSRVGAAARGFRALSVRPGAVVALHMHNVPEWGVAFFGAAACGATVTTSNPAYTPAELAHQLRDSGAQLVVTAPPFAAAAAAAAAAAVAPGAPPLPVLVLGEPATQFLLPLPAGAPRALPEVDAPGGGGGDAARAVAALPYSSGTTGLPKGVALSHANLVSNLEQCTGLVRADDVVVGVLPFFHIYGLTTILCAGLRFGSRVVSLPKFEPLGFLETVQRERATWLPLVPPIISFLAKHPAVGGYDLSSVRAILNGAAPLDHDTQRAVEARLPGAVCRQGYGMTETSPVTHVAPTDAPAKPGSIGPPVAGTECRVADVSTPEALDAAARGAPRLLPAGAAHVGELQVRGPQVMLGYHRNEAATAATLLPGGWLRTGDLGYYDSAGEFYVVDRLKELIKVKGLQVAPAELEGVLLAHPLIYDAAVVGAPDERAGELPVAFVVTRAALLRSMGRASDADALPPLSAGDVQRHVASRVAEYKQLAAVTFVDAGGIPKSAAGKILRRVLRDRVAAEAAAAAAARRS